MVSNLVIIKYCVMDFIDMKKLSEMLSPPLNDSSDSEDDLPKANLVQLGKCELLSYLLGFIIVKYN